MRLEIFLQKSKDLTEEALKLFEEKNPGYGSSDNVLLNFEQAASTLGVRPEEVAAVYFFKHISAILSWVRNGVEPEPIRGRILDAINYLFILHAMSTNPQPTYDRRDLEDWLQAHLFKIDDGVICLNPMLFIVRSSLPAYFSESQVEKAATEVIGVAPQKIVGSPSLGWKGWGIRED